MYCILGMIPDLPVTRPDCVPWLVERCHFSVTSFHSSTTEQINPGRILCLKMWDPGMRKKCKLDSPYSKWSWPRQTERKKKCCQAPAHFLIPLRGALMGDMASAQCRLLKLLWAVLKMRFIYICPLGVSSLRLQLDGKASRSAP